MTDAQNTAREALIPRLTKLLAECAWDESASQTIHEAITLFSALSAPQAPTAAPGASWTEEQLTSAWWSGVRAGNSLGDGPSNARALTAMRAALATLNATPPAQQSDNQETRS